MREFFTGWRRKAGCITLVMSLALMAASSRSHVIEDLITIPFWKYGRNPENDVSLLVPRAPLGLVSTWLIASNAHENSIAVQPR